MYVIEFGLQIKILSIDLIYFVHAKNKMIRIINDRDMLLLQKQ